VSLGLTETEQGPTSCLEVGPLSVYRVTRVLSRLTGRVGYRRFQSHLRVRNSRPMIDHA